MPAKGTKKVMMNGQEVWLPEEQARIEELVSRGVRLTADISLRNKELQEVKEELATIAESKRGDKATVHLEASDGKATVSWAKKVSVEEQGAEELREALGMDWGKVFSVKVSYGLARTYKSFVRALPASMDKIAARIAGCISIAEANPSVKLEV